MKARDILMVSFVCFLTGLAGCSRQDENISTIPWDQNMVWDGTAPAGDALPDFFEGTPKTSVFPESMVGVWEVMVNETTGSKWGIKFEADASIKKINHFLGGQIDLAEGGTSMEGPDPGTYAMFVMGPCIVGYDKGTKILKVKVILDYYEMQLPNGSLKGRIEDYFSGPVSEDGLTWNAEWRSFGWLEGASPPDVNETNANPEKLVFKKIEISDKPSDYNQ